MAASTPLDDAEIAAALGLGDSADRVYAKYAPAIRMVGEVGSTGAYAYGRSDAPGGGGGGGKAWAEAAGGPGPPRPGAALPRDPSGSLEDGRADAPVSPNCVMSLDPPGGSDEDGDERPREEEGATSRGPTRPWRPRRRRHGPADLEPPTGCPPGVLPPGPADAPPSDRSDIHARIEELRDRSLRLRGAVPAAGREAGGPLLRGWRPEDRGASSGVGRSLSPSWRDRLGAAGSDRGASPSWRDRLGAAGSGRGPPPPSSPGTRLEYLTRRSMELRGRAARAGATVSSYPPAPSVAQYTPTTSVAQYAQYQPTPSSAQYAQYQPTPSGAQYEQFPPTPSSSQYPPTPTPQPPPQVPKKVTFEADYAAPPGSGRSAAVVPPRSSLSPVPSGLRTRPSAPPVPSLRTPGAAAREGRTTDGPPRPASPSSLSLRLLSEKILDGHVMTRDRCATCGSALLLPPRSLPRERGVCAVCPALAARDGVSRRHVSRRVAAARLLRDGGGTMTADEVLDASCVEAAREEGRGSRWRTRADGPCAGCGSARVMATRDGGEACPACAVMDRELGPVAHSGRDQGGRDDGGHLLRAAPASGSTPRATGAVPSGAPAGPGLDTLWNDDDNNLRDGANSLVELDDVLRSAGGGASPPPLVASDRSSSVATGDGGGGLGCAGLAGGALVPDLSRIDLTLLRDRINGELARLHGGGQYAALPSLLAGVGTPPLCSPRQQPAPEQQQATASEDPAGRDFARLQDQLRAELDRARESQAALERSIAGELTLASPGAPAGPPASDLAFMTKEDLREELARVMGGMEALEKVLASGAADDDKDDGGDEARGENDHVAADADRNNAADEARLLDEIQEDIRDDHRHRPDSISAREVDATGNLKEYIPPPAFYQTSNIPEYIEVEIDPRTGGDGDGAASVAQSYHTRHLKRSEYGPGRRPDGAGGDAAGRARCCGCLPAASAPARPAPWNDDDTIETDEYTVDYTLNTWYEYGDDASRHGGQHFHCAAGATASKSRDLDTSEHRWREDLDASDRRWEGGRGGGGGGGGAVTDNEQGGRNDDNDDAPFLLRFLSCGTASGGRRRGGSGGGSGGDDRGDEYTMVSSGRGLNGAGRPLDFHDERLREVSGRFLRDGNNEDASEERNQSSVDLSEEYKRRQDSYDMKRELEKLGRAHPPPPQGEEAGVPEDFGSLPPLPGPGRPPAAPGHPRQRRPSAARDTDSHMSPPTIAQSPSISSKRRGLPPLAPAPPAPTPGADSRNDRSGTRSPDYLSDDESESNTGMMGHQARYMNRHYPHQPALAGSPRTALRDGVVRRVGGGSITSDITDWDSTGAPAAGGRGGRDGGYSPASSSSSPRRLGALAEETTGQDLPGGYDVGFEEGRGALRALEGPTFKY